MKNLSQNEGKRVKGSIQRLYKLEQARNEGDFLEFLCIFVMEKITMSTQDPLIEKARELIAARLGWGDSRDWLNQDFISLSEKIFDKTGVSLSHQTLKRIWGKVKYDSLPNTHTLNTLARFLDYENWLQFRAQFMPAEDVAGPEAVPEFFSRKKTNPVYRTIILWSTGVLLLIVLLVNLISGRPAIIDPSDYSFGSRKMVSEGVPNSVVFDLEAGKSPQDSVIIQQSWDARRQARVHKDQKQHTSIYYYPGYFNARLIVNNRVVQRHGLLIKSAGWLPVIRQQPVPVYLNPAEVIRNGRMSVTPAQILAENVHMKPVPPEVCFTNVKDYGQIYTDNFIFETSFRNDYKEGASACQFTTLYLQCQGNVISVSFSSKGCISELMVCFTEQCSYGKEVDLSGFGVDFGQDVKFKMVSAGGKATFFVNDKPVHWIARGIIRAKIIGISYNFQGTGSVDYTRLTNGKDLFEDHFDKPVLPGNTSARNLVNP